MSQQIHSAREGVEEAFPTVAATTPYAEAFQRFLLPNQPFIIKDLAKDWAASRDWVVRDAKEATPNWEYLRRQYGHEEVAVVDCMARKREGRDAGNEPGGRGGGAAVDALLGSSGAVTFDGVIDLWMKGEGQGLYIKDWHLPLSHYRAAAALEDDSHSLSTAPEPFYHIPDIFRDDWMENYYKNNEPEDFAFVYFGSEGTFTGLHRDVYTSYSWSANVLGRKRWHFVAPSEIQYCRRDPDDRKSELLTDLREVDEDLFPHFHKAKIVTVEQEEGDVIFVPSNWYHLVENLSPFTISINHNWCNAVNLPSLYRSMCEEVADTEASLADVKDLLKRREDLDDESKRSREWISIVQDVVKQNAGWNWRTFFAMILYNLQHAATVPALRPSPAFNKQQLLPIFEDFVQRQEYLWDDDVRHCVVAGRARLLRS